MYLRTTSRGVWIFVSSPRPGWSYSWLQRCHNC